MEKLAAQEYVHSSVTSVHSCRQWRMWSLWECPVNDCPRQKVMKSWGKGWIIPTQFSLSNKKFSKIPIYLHQISKYYEAPCHQVLAKLFGFPHGRWDCKAGTVTLDSNLVISVKAKEHVPWHSNSMSRCFPGESQGYLDKDISWTLHNSKRG